MSYHNEFPAGFGGLKVAQLIFFDVDYGNGDARLLRCIFKVLRGPAFEPPGRKDALNYLCWLGANYPADDRAAVPRSLFQDVVDRFACAYYWEAEEPVEVDLFELESPWEEPFLSMSADGIETLLCRPPPGKAVLLAGEGAVAVMMLEDIRSG